MSNLLICDDDKDIVEAVSIYMESEGHKTFKAYNGEEALEIINNNEIHLAIIDIMMPVMDGIVAVTKLRQFSNIPVIMLSAKSEDTDKVLGLNIGADDYVTKPFNPVELIARVKAQLRRFTTFGGTAKNESQDDLTVGEISLNDKSKKTYVNGEEIALTPTEFYILRLFMNNPGKVYSPKEIYKAVWEEIPMNNESAVAVHIRHLREKVEIDPSNPRYIKVVWGQGYVLEAPRA